MKNRCPCHYATLGSAKCSACCTEKKCCAFCIEGGDMQVNRCKKCPCHKPPTDSENIQHLGITNSPYSIETGETKISDSEDAAIEATERIVIEYANLSGRESTNRSEFRDRALKILRSYGDKREAIGREEEFDNQESWKEAGRAEFARELLEKMSGRLWMNY